MAEYTNLPEILTACRFYLGLSLDKKSNNSKDIDCHFLECRGFQQTQAPIEIYEVTNKIGTSAAQQIVRTKIPSNVKCGNITLRKGMTSSKELWDWFDLVQNGGWAKQRRFVHLSIYNQASEEVARFELTNAWPSSYKLTDVNARSTEIEIEELEIAFEQFKREK